MGLRPALLGLAVAALGILPADAAPPSNDEYANRTVIGSIPYSSVQDTSEATFEEGEDGVCGLGGGSVWFAIEPTQPRQIELTTDGSTYATGVNFYDLQEPPATVPDFTSFPDCHAPPNGTLSVRFTAFLEPGRHYLIQVMGWRIDDPGGELHLSVMPGLAADNDDFAGAKVIPSLPYEDEVAGRFLNYEPGQPEECTEPTTIEDQTAGLGPSAWYRYTPSADEVVGFRGGGPIAIWTGSSIDSLVPVECTTGDWAVFSAHGGVGYVIQLGGPANGDTFSIAGRRWGSIPLLDVEQVSTPPTETVARIEGRPRDDGSGIYDVTSTAPDGSTYSRGIQTFGNALPSFDMPLPPGARLNGLYAAVWYDAENCLYLPAGITCVHPPPEAPWAANYTAFLVVRADVSVGNMNLVITRRVRLADLPLL